MKWTKKVIPPFSLVTTINSIKKSIKQGDPLIEKLRCVYLLEDSSLIYCMMPYDFIDNLNENTKIKYLSIYQVSESDT